MMEEFVLLQKRPFYTTYEKTCHFIRTTTKERSLRPTHYYKNLYPYTFFLENHCTRQSKNTGTFSNQNCIIMVKQSVFIVSTNCPESKPHKCQMILLRTCLVISKIIEHG